MAKMKSHSLFDIQYTILSPKTAFIKLSCLYCAKSSSMHGHIMISVSVGHKQYQCYVDDPVSRLLSCKLQRYDTSSQLVDSNEKIYCNCIIEYIMTYITAFSSAHVPEGSGSVKSYPARAPAQLQEDHILQPLMDSIILPMETAVMSWQR